MKISNPRISVVLATYEGGSFLIDQIQSIINQAKPPDELVVIDDCSTLDPFPVLNSMLELGEIEFIYDRNFKNCGSNYSFRKGVALSTGDLIFFSDQDDIWYFNKIKAHADLHSLEPEAMVVFNDCEYLIGQKTIESPTKAEVIKSYHGGLDHFVAGCCTSFKRPVAEAVSSNLFNFLNYDDQVHAIGRVSKTRVYLNQPLQSYRRHENNQSQLPQNRPEMNRNRLKKYKNFFFNLVVEKFFINFFIIDEDDLKYSRDILNNLEYNFGVEMIAFSSALESIRRLKSQNTIGVKLKIILSLLRNRNFLKVVGGFLLWQIRFKSKQTL